MEVVVIKCVNAWAISAEKFRGWISFCIGRIVCVCVSSNDNHKAEWMHIVRRRTHIPIYTICERTVGPKQIGSVYGDVAFYDSFRFFSLPFVSIYFIPLPLPRFDFPFSTDYFFLYSLDSPSVIRRYFHILRIFISALAFLSVLSVVALIDDRNGG